jgi:hypothetical protein
VMVAASVLLLPRGILDRAFVLDLGRALLAGVGTTVLCAALPPLSPWLAMPVCVAVFSVLSVGVGLAGRADLEVLRAMLDWRRGASG